VASREVSIKPLLIEPRGSTSANGATQFSIVLKSRAVSERRARVLYAVAGSHHTYSSSLPVFSNFVRAAMVSSTTLTCSSDKMLLLNCASLVYKKYSFPFS